MRAHGNARHGFGPGLGEEARDWGDGSRDIPKSLYNRRPWGKCGKAVDVTAVTADGVWSPVWRSGRALWISRRTIHRRPQARRGRAFCTGASTARTHVIHRLVHRRPPREGRRALPERLPRVAAGGSAAGAAGAGSRRLLRRQRPRHRVAEAGGAEPRGAELPGGRHGGEAARGVFLGRRRRHIRLALRSRSSCARSSSLPSWSVTFWTAYMTVEWSRPEKNLPISG